MLGAIVGDVVGSIHEGSGMKEKLFPLWDEFCRFTDDTVLTAAVANKLLAGAEYVDSYHEFFHLYPQAGYGMSFIRWAGYRNREPYESWGNGSAMRVSPIAWAFETLDEVLEEAERSAEPTHNHPEGIRGAQAVAAAVFLGRMKRSKAEIRHVIEERFSYDLHQTVDEIRPQYRTDETAAGSVPQSIVAFLDSTGFEDAIRNAVSLGGDADTMACIAGSIAEAYYGEIPEKIRDQALSYLDSGLIKILNDFREQFQRNAGYP